VRRIFPALSRHWRGEKEAASSVYQLGGSGEIGAEYHRPSPSAATPQ
jgi:hypothetical protein